MSKEIDRTSIVELLQNRAVLGGSPGVVVMGDDSCSRGRGFESERRILDGHFLHCFVIKLYCLFEKTKNVRKRGRGWAIFLKKK